MRFDRPPQGRSMLVQLPLNWRGRTILPETESEGDHRSLCVSRCENREVQPKVWRAAR